MDHWATHKYSLMIFNLLLRQTVSAVKTSGGAFQAAFLLSVS